MRYYMAFVMLAASSVAWAQEQSAAQPRLLHAKDLAISIESDALERQYVALQAISAATIEYSERGPVNSIQGITSLSLPANVKYLAKGSEAADKILPVIGDMLLAKGSESLVVRKNALIDGTTRALRLAQNIRGIPVINSVVAIDYDDSSMRVSGLTAEFTPDRDLASDPKLSAKDAEQVIPEALKQVKELRDVQIEIIDGTYLGYYAEPGYTTPAQLVWVVEAALGSMHELFFVNALTGAIAGRQQLTHAISRTVHTANGGTLSIPGGLNNGNKLNPPDFGGDQNAIEVYSHIADADAAVLTRLPYAAASAPTSVKMVVRQIHQSPHPPYTATHKLTGGIDYLTFSPARTGFNSWTKPRDVAVHEYG